MKYVIITGVGIGNLGSESMACIAIEIAKKLVPGCKIVIAGDCASMVGKINFKTCRNDFPSDFCCRNAHWQSRLLYSHINRISDPYYDYIFSMTKLIIDVSGYAFSSKFSSASLYMYLNRIYIAKKYRIKMLIMPQSFGPVDLSFKEMRNFDLLSRSLLKYPEKIYVRERSGFEFLKRYTKRNIQYCPDMVLLYPKEIEYSLLKKSYINDGIIIKKRCVGIIPNEKIYSMSCMTKKKYIEIINEIIDHVKKLKYNIDIICHCSLDMEFAKEISLEKKVRVIDCINGGARFYDEIVMNYVAIIGSRYHSIVHAYRRGVPALVLGWEDKYNELLELMDQKSFLYDCRNKINNRQLISSLNNLLNNHEQISQAIKKKLDNIRSQYAWEY